MLLYFLAAAIGFILRMLIEPSDGFGRSIRENLLAGKRVIICYDDDATILEMVGKDRIRISKATADFFPEEELDPSFVGLDDSRATERSGADADDLPRNDNPG